MRPTLLLLPLALSLSLPAHADPLDDAILAEMSRSHIPGVSIAVVKDGKIIREQGYGLADIENNVKVTPDTVFQSGSVGKTFTAALVMLLVQDGKLALADPVSKYLANTPKAWEGITIRHLLTHTSGLGDPYAKLDLTKDYTEEELIALEAQIPMLFAPGEKWSYSNMGYHLLGFICNKAGGKFYGDQLRERIFAPLDMGTRIISEADIVPHRAHGYERKGGKLVNQSWVAPRLNTTADGSLYLTARDLAKWDLALYGDQVLPASVRQASWTPARLNDGKATEYGYGWQLFERNGHKTIAHGGAWQGFRAQLYRFVDDKLSVVVLANSASARPAKLGDIVAAHYLPALAPKPAPAIADTEPAVAERVRAMFARIADGKPPEGVSDKVAAALSPEFIAMVADDLRDWGALNRVEALSRSVDGEVRKYSYRLNYASGTLLVEFALGKSDKIDQLRMRPE
ncbi:serine hydrolase domain-containing protein [Pseudoduganella violaceinigra]|uniref:serine hydrolase domain-containing protein n=1 Tax=Pseudoduganella violaceinigra TaxID=246602 RepID=UPI000420A236|nr:serine hydrolase domain-containing protein [Pseudoduganella violaceinigra]